MLRQTRAQTEQALQVTRRNVDFNWKYRDPQRELKEGQRKGQPHQWLSPSGHLAAPGSIVGRHDLGPQLPSSGQRPGVLPSSQPCTGLQHTVSSAWRARKPERHGGSGKRISPETHPSLHRHLRNPEANCTKRFPVTKFFHNHS